MENLLIRENGGFVARHRYARLTARKARLIADMIRGRGANDALELLMLSPKRAATFYKKVVEIAVANAAADEEVNVNNLVIVDARAGRRSPGEQPPALPTGPPGSRAPVAQEDEPPDRDRRRPPSNEPRESENRAKGVAAGA